MPRPVARTVLFAAALLACAPPAWAQLDFSGDWSLLLHEDHHWRGTGAEIGEYTGLPLSPAGRLRAQSWDPSSMTLLERTCIPLPVDDVTDFGNIRIWKEVDPQTQRVIAWRQFIEWEGQERVIWMDGRPRPSEYAPHTWQGFSTGRWERNQLTVTTTHLKTGAYERVGTLRSDRGSVTERWMRHGDYLTIMVIIRDPVYLAEPLVRTRHYVLDPNQRMRGSTCTPTAEIAGRPEGYVPHYLPGRNPFLLTAMKKFGVPEIALGGGPETMYPEFQQRLRAGATPTASLAARPAPAPAPAAAARGDASSTDVTVLPVQGNVYLIASAAGNTTVQVGERAVVVVDTQPAALADKVLAAIRQISNKPIRYVINTHGHPDRTGGNPAISEAGDAVPLRREDPITGDTSARAPVVAHENTLTRMRTPGTSSASPFAFWPTETYVTPEHRLFNDEGLQIIHVPAAHTDGDSIVFFRRSDVISAGDLITMGSYPMIDRASGGTLRGLLAGLNQLIRLTIPRDKHQGGTYVIPGSGRILDQADVVEYRDMVTIIRDRVADLIKQGMTLDQVRAAQPTLDYDGRFGAPTPTWTKEMFLETVYAELTQGKTE